MSSKPLPSISVVIPCYNAERFIRQTLESVLRQSHLPLEIIVVDDGSTDNSAALASSLDDLVRVERQRNQGESVARNRGMEMARGEWIALLDADDIWYPQKLQKQVEAWQSSAPDVICFYSDFNRFCDEQDLGVVIRPELHREDDYRIQMLCNSDAAILPSASLFPRELGLAIQFPEETRYGEDMMFFSQLRDRGRLHKIPECLVGYRTFAGMQSRGARFRLLSVQSRYEWAQRHSDRYSAKELQQVADALAPQLVEAHDIAYWARNHEVVQACRDYYRVLQPRQAYPESLRWRLYPAWLMKLKDRIDRFRTGEKLPAS
ncbi:MAG: glycosyltransferase family 2 protein [Planctomycetota bacterium]